MGTQQALKILENLPQKNVRLHKITLNYEKYQKQFQNAICLLVYDVELYEDKFSAVALDALYAGCPLITVPNTWMGEVVLQYQAGILVDDRTPKTLYQALQTIKANYAQYRENARTAGQQLAKTHDPKCTLQLVKDLL